jgi:hypothetical protein
MSTEFADVFLGSRQCTADDAQWKGLKAMRYATPITALGALLIAGGAILAAAGPALADPIDDQLTEQSDQAFLKALKDYGIRTKSDTYAIDLAHSTCATLARTGSVQAVLEHVQIDTKWKSNKDIANFGSLAVQVYCPGSMPKR